MTREIRLQLLFKINDFEQKSKERIPNPGGGDNGEDAGGGGAEEAWRLCSRFASGVPRSNTFRHIPKPKDPLKDSLDNVDQSDPSSAK